MIGGTEPCIGGEGRGCKGRGLHQEERDKVECGPGGKCTATRPGGTGTATWPGGTDTAPQPGGEVPSHRALSRGSGSWGAGPRGSGPQGLAPPLPLDPQATNLVPYPYVIDVGSIALKLCLDDGRARFRLATWGPWQQFLGSGL